MKYLLSLVAFFAASYQIRRRFDRMDMPKGPTRSALIFSLALAISYAVVALAERFGG